MRDVLPPPRRSSRFHLDRRSPRPDPSAGQEGVTRTEMRRPGPDRRPRTWVGRGSASATTTSSPGGLPPEARSVDIRQPVRSDIAFVRWSRKPGEETTTRAWTRRCLSRATNGRVSASLMVGRVLRPRGEDTPRCHVDTSPVSERIRATGLVRPGGCPPLLPRGDRLAPVPYLVEPPGSRRTCFGRPRKLLPCGVLSSLSATWGQLGKPCRQSGRTGPPTPRLQAGARSRRSSRSSPTRLVRRIRGFPLLFTPCEDSGF